MRGAGAIRGGMAICHWLGLCLYKGYDITFHMSSRERNGENGWSGIGLMCGLAALFGLSSPIAAQAQFPFTINFPDTNTITIIGYTGDGGSVDIPSDIEGKVVARIGNHAFYGRGDLTAVEIPDSVTSIGEWAFGACDGYEPSSGLTTVIIGSGVTNIEQEAFSDSDFLTGVYFHGDAPNYEGTLFFDAEDVIVYRQESAAGWPTVPDLWADRPTALWVPIPEPVPYTYTTNSPDTNTLTITGYTGPGGTADIPSVIAGKTVTAIGVWAFENCVSLTRITIPDSVTIIGDRAFTFCSSLTNAVIGNGVTDIGACAFVDCTSLNGITIPDSVLNVGSRAFGACTSLTNATIGNGVTDIGAYAFVDCTSLNGITIPDSVITLGDEAFTNCTSLTNATIGNGVTNIGYCTFTDCSSLTRITIPDNVAAIGAGAFAGCSSLTDATLGNSLTNIGYYAFAGCSNLICITIPDNVAAIGVGAFSDCSSLTNASIGNGVANIGDEAFAGCSRLIEITVSYGNSAYGSSNGILFNKDLTTIMQCPGGWTGDYIVSDSVTNIGSGAFSGCNQLSSIHIPDRVLNVGSRAFGACSGLTNAAIGHGVTNIGSGAFSGCNQLSSIQIPDRVMDIGERAFEACSGLTNAVIGNSVAAIRYRAFEGCTSLTRITIPDSVINIQDWAFASCTSLTGIYFQGNAPYHGRFTFDGSDNSTVYYSPHTTGWPPVPDPWAWRPTALWQWRPSVPGEVGVVSNHFGFNIISPSGMVVVVDACTNLIQANWVPVATHVLTNGTYDFSDAEWTNCPGRFYRMRSQ